MNRDRLLINLYRFVAVLILVSWIIMLCAHALLAAEPTVDKELELLNEKRMRIELQIRVKDYEIKELVVQYQDIMSLINARQKKEEPAPAKSGK